MGSVREIVETLLDKNEQVNKNNKSFFSSDGSFFIYINTDMEKPGNDVSSVPSCMDEINVNSLSNHVSHANLMCQPVVDYEEKFAQLKKIIQEMIGILNEEIVQLSGIFGSYLNRSIIQVKTSEKAALTSLLDGGTFNEMSIVADIEMDTLHVRATKSPSSLILHRLSEARNIDDFFQSQKDMLIFTRNI